MARVEITSLSFKRKTMLQKAAYFCVTLKWSCHVQILLANNQSVSTGNILNQTLDLFFKLILKTRVGKETIGICLVSPWTLGPEADMKKSLIARLHQDAEKIIGTKSVHLCVSSPHPCSSLLLFLSPPCSAPTMLTLSSTSPRTIPPSCASFAATSSNSSTAPTPRAGGAVATDTWATSHRSMSSQSTSASDLWPSDKGSSGSPFVFFYAPTRPACHAAPRSPTSVPSRQVVKSKLLTTLPRDYPVPPASCDAVTSPISTSEAIGLFQATSVIKGITL